MSKYQRSEPAALPKHRHCSACGTPIELGKEFCSDKCRATYKRASRTRIRNFVLITAAIVAFYLFIVLRGI